jgi:hypothetical protein
VVSLQQTDVSVVRTASIISGMMAAVRPDDDAVRISETSLYFNETTWCYIPEGCHLHFHTVFI